MINCPKIPVTCKYLFVGGFNMKKKTIGVMTKSRGQMPPPVKADKPKKGKGSYKRNEGKRVNNI